MKLIQVDKEHIKRTVEWWQNHTYATHADILRVEKFRQLDADKATFEEVSEAYGGTGWAGHFPCVECGDTQSDHVQLGAMEVCVPCIEKAHSLSHPETPKKSLFKFWE